MSGEVKDFIKAKEILFNDWIKGEIAGGPAILNESATATNPTIIPDKGDDNTGLSHFGSDTLFLVTGGVSALSLKGASSNVIQTIHSNVGLTANVGSAQGNGVIVSSYNVYDTVGTAGDAATLPAVFDVGTIIYIKNGAAANSMDVFPASGDDLGAGANTVRALAAKDFVVYIGTTANATWEELMRGTCSA